MVCRVFCVCHTRLKLSGDVDECKPLPAGAADAERRRCHRAALQLGPGRQGLTFVHFSAQL